MKVVLDTNVLLSGLMLPKSVPGRIVQAWRTARFDLVLSEPLLEEMERALAYPKIRSRIGWDQDSIQRFTLMLRLRSDIVDITNFHVTVPRDPADSPVLATLITSQAECLISGDKDLLVLKEQYPILTPAEFSKKL